MQRQLILSSVYMDSRIALAYMNAYYPCVELSLIRSK